MSPAGREVSPRRCLADGGVVESDGDRAGWCAAGSGFALAYRVTLEVPVLSRDGLPSGRLRPDTVSRVTACPFVCPLCRKPLTWDGGCDPCHGRRSLLEPMTFPGPRYELQADRHWVRVALGPRPVATPDEIADALDPFKAAFSRAFPALRRRTSWR